MRPAARQVRPLGAAGGSEERVRFREREPCGRSASPRRRLRKTDGSPRAGAMRTPPGAASLLLLVLAVRPWRSRGEPGAGRRRACGRLSAGKGTSFLPGAERRTARCAQEGPGPDFLLQSFGFWSSSF